MRCDQDRDFDSRNARRLHRQFKLDRFGGNHHCRHRLQPWRGSNLHSRNGGNRRFNKNGGRKNARGVFIFRNDPGGCGGNRFDGKRRRCFLRRKRTLDGGGRHGSLLHRFGSLARWHRWNRRLLVLDCHDGGNWELLKCDWRTFFCFNSDRGSRFANSLCLDRRHRGENPHADRPNEEIPRILRQIPCRERNGFWRRVQRFLETGGRLRGDTLSCFVKTNARGLRSQQRNWHDSANFHLRPPFPDSFSQ